MIAEAVGFLKERIHIKPAVAVVLGSGLGAFADELSDPIRFSYAQIPGFAKSTAIGHAGKLFFGYTGGRPGCRDVREISSLMKAIPPPKPPSAFKCWASWAQSI